MKALALPLALLLGAAAFALNKGNAGPDQVEIKFNLPPPKPLSPAEELATFRLEKGFRIELVASEPMIETPVAISFDDQGRMFVVEMRTEAAEMGLASRAVPADQVLSVATDMAREIAVNVSPVSAALTKQLMWEGMNMSVDQMNGFRATCWVEIQPG